MSLLAFWPLRFLGGFLAPWPTIARMRAFLQGVAWEVERAIHKLES